MPAPGRSNAPNTNKALDPFGERLLVHPTTTNAGSTSWSAPQAIGPVMTLSWLLNIVNSRVPDAANP